MHTSAGRTPTEEGLKTYVNDILAVGRLSDEMRSHIERQLAGGQPKADAVLSICSKVLSNITRHVGVVAAPLMERMVLKQLYFIRLSRREVLAVLVGDNGLVRNKVIKTSADESQDDLNQVNRYLEEVCSHLTLDEIRNRILESMGDEKKAFDSLYARAFELTQASGEPEPDESFDLPIYLEGQGNLLEYPEFNEAEAMRALFAAFEDKRRILELLDKVADSGQVRIIIGSEAAAAALSGLALVASPTPGVRELWEH